MTEKQEQEKQILNYLNENNENNSEETSEQTEEEARGQAEETNEQEQLSEEEREIAREIEAYKAKIAEIDAKIAEYAAKKVDDLKREAMRKRYYTDEQIERYLKFVEGETREEIERSIAALAQDIPPKGDNFADPSPFNGVKQKPTAADPGEVGKTLFERIKHRIWGGGATL